MFTWLNYILFCEHFSGGNDSSFIFYNEGSLVDHKTYVLGPCMSLIPSSKILPNPFARKELEIDGELFRTSKTQIIFSQTWDIFPKSLFKYRIENWITGSKDADESIVKAGSGVIQCEEATESIIIHLKVQLQVLGRGMPNVLETTAVVVASTQLYVCHDVDTWRRYTRIRRGRPGSRMTPASLGRVE